MTPSRRHIALIVHGGAGDIPEDERPAHRRGLAEALERGWARLAAGASSLDVVEEAVSSMEDDPAFDAGVGSHLRLDGSISLDASIMTGEGRRAGAVAGIRRVRHPIRLARAILEKTPHVFLIGEGAESFAAEQSMELCEPEFFVIERERERLERLRERAAGERKRGDDHAGNGTVGAVSVDRHGHIAAGTSTGGAPGSMPGRVGDTPIIGAGTYADDRFGAVSCTGLGEKILRVTLAREAVRQLELGASAQDACFWAVEHLKSETGGTCGLICLDTLGGGGSAYTTAWMGSLLRSEPL